MMIGDSASGGLRVGDDFGDPDLALGLVGGVGEHGFRREAFARLVLAHHVIDGRGVGGGLDAGDVEGGEGFGMAEDGLELPLENGAFFLIQFEPGQAGDIADVNVLRGHRGRIGEERRGGGKGKDGQWIGE